MLREGGNGPGTVGEDALAAGAIAGIGRAVAGAFAAGGEVLNGRRAERVEEALVRLRVRPEEEGRVTAGLIGAVADRAPAGGCASLTAAGPEIGIPVNDPGIFGPHPFAEIPDEDRPRLLAVTVMSRVRLPRHSFLRRRGAPAASTKGRKRERTSHHGTRSGDH